MSVQPPEDIKAFLQKKDVQERIQQSMLNARSNATVTISRAAELFGFSESQLREWEKKGLVTTKREARSQEGKGHRQYSPNELDKLAIIKALLEEGDYAPGAIPPNVDELWEQVVQAQQNHLPEHRDEYSELMPSSANKHLPIDKRVEQAEREVFWRYFTSQAIRLSLLLICEDIPDTIAGIILPLQNRSTSARVRDPHALPQIGEALVGWLDLNRSFYTFLDTAPSFEFPSDFRIQRLVDIANTSLRELASQDETLIVIQRNAKPLAPSLPVVATILRLLAPIYQQVESWRPAFAYGMRDWFYQTIDFTSSQGPSDDVLNGLTNMVIQLGGKTADDRDRWTFCCLLLPDNPHLPLQQHSLLVQAQSKNAPYKVGISSVSAKYPGLSLRAYQSGHVIYRQNMSVKDSFIAYQDEEQSTHSAIAVPIAGEDGLSIGVLYVASDTVHAFPEEDHRLLRLVGKMVEELLLTYQARQQATGKLIELIDAPDVVDTSFKKFNSENDFVHDLETLLETIQKNNTSEYSSEKVVSFIAVDIDNQSVLATKYGDRLARNLSLEVGSRLEGYLKLFDKLKHQRIYHMHADRYYLFLDGMSLDDARINAELIRVALNGNNYRIDAQRSTDERTASPEGVLELPEVTVHLGITSYEYKKLHEVLQRYAFDTAVAEVESLIMGSLDEVLVIGERKGGDVIISWDPGLRGYLPWRPPTA